MYRTYSQHTLHSHPTEQNHGVKSSNKQMLIDEIISKCSKIQVPRVQLINQSRRQVNVHRGLLIQDKQNELYHGLKINSNRPSQKRMSSIDKHRASFESKGQKNSFESSSGKNNPIYSENKEYFTKTVKAQPQIKEPIVFRNNVAPKKNTSFYESKAAECLIPKSIAIKRQIQTEKEEHISHCRKEERKLRLFYVELENKLCEMRNKELQVLAEYEAMKLRQYESCLSSIEKDSKLQNYEDCSSKLQQIKNQHRIRVDSKVRPDIQGCLLTGVSGVMFSFDQSSEPKNQN